jgi:hypothetical protein
LKSKTGDSGEAVRFGYKDRVESLKGQRHSFSCRYFSAKKYKLEDRGDSQIYKEKKILEKETPKEDRQINEKEKRKVIFQRTQEERQRRIDVCTVQFASKREDRK